MDHVWTDLMLRPWLEDQRARPVPRTQAEGGVEVDCRELVRKESRRGEAQDPVQTRLRKLLLHGGNEFTRATGRRQGRLEFGEVSAR